MRRVDFKVGFRVIVLSLFCLPCVHAKWSEPVLLSELHDLQNAYPAFAPAISSDGLTIYFARQVPGTISPFYIFEARRDSVGGLFQVPKRLVELGNNGNYVETPWISLDGKRLYFAEIMKYQGLWHRFIRISSRTSTGQPWGPATSIMEIHEFFNESVDTTPALTGDELTIFWESNRSGLSSWKIYSAVRPSLDKPFTQISEVVELNALGAVEPHLLPDGLTVYFRAPNPKSGIPNIWKGTRAARDGVFGDFVIISDLCDDVRRASDPYLTPDGKTIFFGSKMGADLTKNWGIWESHWVEDPIILVRKNLQQALDAKKAMLIQIDTAVAQEREAMDSLKFLFTQGGYPGLTPEALNQAFNQTSLAVSRQLLARRLLDQSIQALQSALGWLVPKPVPAAQQ